MNASSIEVGGLSPPRPAKFSLAANYDPELIPALGAYRVDEVYGKFPTDGVSGSRPRYLATPLSEADLCYPPGGSGTWRAVCRSAAEHDRGKLESLAGTTAAAKRVRK